MKNTRWSELDTKGSRAPNAQGLHPHDAEIDATLSLLARVQPASELEQRIHLHLAGASPATTPWHWLKTRLLRGFLPPLPSHTQGRAISTRTQAVAVSLVVATAALGGGLLYKSGHTVTPPPVMQVVPHAGAFGAAAAIRVSPQPVTPALRMHARGAAHNRHARASVANHHKPLPPGVAVPHSPMLEQAFPTTGP